MEPTRFRRGFTLVELMVVLTIIVVITTVVVASQSSFNKTLVLANTAYDIALTLRSAETYGLGSRAFGGTANAGYGLNFQSGAPQSFTLFADTYPAPSTSSVCHPISDSSAPNAQPGNCSYEPSQGEKVTSYTLGNGIIVSDFCAYALGSWSCAYAHGGGLTALDIVFARPNPEPFMSVNGSYSASFPITAACFTITSPQEGAQYISVAASGQIVANASPCP
ncbi:MAG: prepilin-type N-terminal cleavage/methylation domain-containing protein [Patescibacteria group bacterium]